MKWSKKAENDDEAIVIVSEHVALVPHSYHWERCMSMQKMSFK